MNTTTPRGESASPKPRKKGWRLFKRDSSGRIMPADAPGYKDAPYYFEFELRKKRYLRCLGTNVASDAQVVANRAYDLAVAEDWEKLNALKLRREAFATLGEIFQIYRKTARVDDATKRNNIYSLRSILRTVRDKDLTEEQMDQLESSILTRRLLLDYQTKLVESAGEDFLAVDRAHTTANSTIRQAKSIFAEKMMIHYEDLRLPELEKFKRTPLLPEPDHAFEPPPAELVMQTWAASKQLKDSDPNAYKAFLLAITCGLRKKEIAHVRRSEIIALPVIGVDGKPAKRDCIALRTRTQFRTKNRKVRYVPIETEVLTELDSLCNVVAMPSPTPVDPAAPPAPVEDYIITGTAKERTDLVFRRVNAWLKNLGWHRHKKIHECRKLYGSFAAAQAGAMAGPKLLGNSPEVFNAHYHALLELPEVRVYQKAAPHQ